MRQGTECQSDGGRRLKVREIGAKDNVAGRGKLGVPRANARGRNVIETGASSQAVPHHRTRVLVADAAAESQSSRRGGLGPRWAGFLRLAPGSRGAILPSTSRNRCA